MQLRKATAADQPGIAELIRKVYAEYGERLCLDTADSDLLDLDRFYFQQGGWFWVLDASPRQSEVPQIPTIVGTHALLPLDRETCTFRRLYLADHLRGGCYGRLLMQATMDAARQQGFTRVEFWSDTRFERAHRFFQKMGFERTGKIRNVEGGFEPYKEYQFAQGLAPQQRG